MPKSTLREPFEQLERDIIETLKAGHGDLGYPESYSDMQGAVRALLQMFKVERRPLALAMADLLPEEKRTKCQVCDGEGWVLVEEAVGACDTEMRRYPCRTCHSKGTVVVHG